MGYGALLTVRRTYGFGLSLPRPPRLWFIPTLWEGLTVSDQGDRLIHCAKALHASWYYHLPAEVAAYIGPTPEFDLANPFCANLIHHAQAVLAADASYRDGTLAGVFPTKRGT